VVNAVFVQKDRIYSLLLLWFVAAWLPFEFSPSKLPAYTAAAHVPFAMMIARVLNKARQQVILTGWLFRLQILIQILIIAAIPAAVLFLDLPLLFKVSSLAAASLLSLLAVKLLPGKEVNLTGLMALNGGFMVFVWLIVYGQIDPVKNSPELVGNYLKGRYRQAVIANSGGHPPGLFVYTERAVGKAILMTNSDTLRQLATSMNQTAFVFSERQWEEIGPAAGLRLDTVIRGRFTDRKGMASYFIASRRRY
jgi:4-amino-4-deoxy-L-arabinose transferase-like glycosyltransferase